MRRPLDPVTADELRHDKELEQAQELLDARIDELIPKVWEEVNNGDHDDELSQSSWVQLDAAMRIARVMADGGDIRLGDLDDLNLQITDYVRDVAERRAAR